MEPHITTFLLPFLCDVTPSVDGIKNGVREGHLQRNGGRPDLQTNRTTESAQHKLHFCTSASQSGLAAIYKDGRAVAGYLGSEERRISGRRGWG